MPELDCRQKNLIQITRKRIMSPSLLLQLLLLIRTSSLSADGSMDLFSRSFIRLCLKVQFVHDQADVAPGSLMDCARACSSSARCRAFRLTPGSGHCRTFEFDRCVHRANAENCSEFGWAFVRRLPGLSDGRLCPGGYGDRHFTSVYRLFPVASWSSGLSTCQAQLGLTKFADGIDRAEVDHLHWMKTNVNSGKAFFVGGYRIGSFASGTWFWHACNASFLAEVWLPGQPNSGDLYNRAEIWAFHESGIDDVTETHARINAAMCECVDPFA